MITVGVIGLAGADARPAAAEEQVMLPYACAVDRGRVTLSPAPERAYKVIGPHASHAFTACLPGQPDRCRTWHIHKFDLACGAARVSWLAVVGAQLEAMPRRGRVEMGRLSLTLGPAWRIGGAPRSAQPMLAFPAGYAPAIGFGARFVGSTTPPPTVVEAKPIEPRSADLKPEPKPAAAKPTTPDADAAAPLSAPRATIAEAWVTTTTAGDAKLADAATAVPSFSLGRAVIGLIGLLLAWLALVVVRRRSTPAAQPMNSPLDAIKDMKSAQRDADDAALCSELIARAVNLHRTAKDALPAITSDNLRAILSDDIANVQQTLLSPALTDNIAAQRWEPVRVTMSATLADLERIGRIIAGVLTTAKSAAPKEAVPIPETAAEAFEVLGLNPDASSTIIKKVVDGLRQSWHPDYARDDADRMRREDRMKQINIAWDLIRKSGHAETVLTSETMPATERTAA